MAALRAAGLAPHSFLPEYGARQYEVTIHPTPGCAPPTRRSSSARWRGPSRIASALARSSRRSSILTGSATARISISACATRPTGPFSMTRAPVRAEPGGASSSSPGCVTICRRWPRSRRPRRCRITGCGRTAGRRPGPMSRCGTAAPASASARSIGRDDAARQFNIEYRVADAAASPYLALGAVIWAGVDGIRNERSLPPEPGRSFWDMSEAEREAAGARKLPRSLDGGARASGGQRSGARMVRRDVLPRLSDVQAGRIARHRGADRGRDLRPLCGGVLTHPQISI